MSARSGDAILSRMRWGGALAAVAALAALMAVGPPVGAEAATGPGYNQITGAGQTASAVTVPWTQGLLGSNNKPIAAANADRSSAHPTSPLSFMYSDFQKLKVTVSQTQDITHQGVTVTWSGGEPTIEYNKRPAGNFLQVMECYGDSSSGPSPQDCQFGSQSMLGTAQNMSIGTRSGDLCAAGSAPSVSTPPASLDGDGPQLGCDPGEPAAGANPPDVQSASAQQYFIPFVPVNDPSKPAYSPSDTSKYFDEFSTNEVPEAVTNPDGTGQLQFETLTSTQAPGLGCGKLESNGQTRNCWLVIVPRGQFEPNGFQISPATNTTAYLLSSPLSASNWAMRIQIHLGYAPVQTFCPIGTQEIETVGTQIVARAVQSWQLALNKAAHCTKIYGYSAVPEASSTQQLANKASGVGLAFTTIPIGSEAARDGTHEPPLPRRILYAPVAVSALGFGFNIDEPSGYISTPVRLTPELLAKSLTQVYRTDLPDFYPPAGSQYNGPPWSIPNPLNITFDQQFKTLNPGVPVNGGGNGPLAPLLTEDHSALNQQIWQWIQADPGASSWLNEGKTDATNPLAIVDPAYMALKLGTPPAIDSFPRAYSGCLDLGQFQAVNQPPKEELKCSLDLLPYVNNYDQAATYALTGDDPSAAGWDSELLAPDGSLGWWDKTGVEPIGEIFVWGISDTPDLAAYGLIDAQLCSDSGTNCVGPSTASLTTALDSAKADSAGLLEVNPADPGAGGYPLTQVTYAAVPTNQSAAHLNNYASLIAYAAGAGQATGVAPGNLPPGYLPLPAKLRAQAMAVVATLRADAGGSRSRSPSPSRSASRTSSAPGAASPTTPGGTSQAASSSGAVAPTVSSPTPVVGLSIKPPSAELAATRTGREPVGAIRWALLTVLLAGAACAAGGTVLRSGGVARWLRRMRP